MSAAATLTHAQLGQLLARLRLGVDASDLHGSLTGYLCGGGSAGADGWLRALELETDRVADPTDTALRGFYEECAAWFTHPQTAFEPLLPNDGSAMAARGAALVEWCRGFLGGLGLAGAPARHSWSTDASEILREFSTIAGAQFTYGDAEEDEIALAEVIEFVRAGALLLYAELTAAAPAHPTVH
ncbi:MAG: UPF0149 family protein [Rudaea sp.]